MSKQAILLEQGSFYRDDDYVCLVLDQHTELDMLVTTHWTNSP